MDQDDVSLAMAFRLQLEELEQLQSQQKGKQKSGNPTDFELAMEMMRDDLIAAPTSLQDHVLAVSTSTAIATDQTILSFLSHDESVAEHDHNLVRDLGENVDEALARLGEGGPSNSRQAEKSDVIALTLGDLMEKMKLNRKGGEQANPVCFTETIGPVKKCCSCLEDTEIFLTNTACGHEFCRDCLKHLFLGSIKDEELYPPRCCGKGIQPEIALRLLTYTELLSFSEKAIEYSAENRLYCAEPTCSKFIPSSSIHGEHGICPDCHRETHLPCGALAHPNIDCPLDSGLQDILEIAGAQHWMRCSNCRNLVELHHGCNHITCR